MCQIYAHADPILYESRNRSLRISKVVTSIKLENLFWDTLSEIAHEDGLTTNQLIAKLHDEVYGYRGEITNFASFLRVTCMRYLEVKAQSGLAAKRVLYDTDARVRPVPLVAGHAPPCPHT